MMELTDKDVETLSIAIIQQAADDYAAAFQGYKVDGKVPEYAIVELEQFFHSDYYNLLTEVSGDYIMKHVKIRELKKMIARYKEALSLSRTSHLKVHVNKIPEKPATENRPAEKEKPAINYIIPPKLADALFVAMRRQLTELEKELQALEMEDEDA